MPCSVPLLLPMTSLAFPSPGHQPTKPDGGGAHVGDPVGVAVGVGVNVAVGVGVNVAVAVGVKVGVAVGVNVAVGVGDAVAVGVGEGQSPLNVQFELLFPLSVPSKTVISAVPP